MNQPSKINNEDYCTNIGTQNMDPSCACVTPSTKSKANPSGASARSQLNASPRYGTEFYVSHSPYTLEV